MFGDTKVHTTPKDFFLQLGAIVTLYISAISLMALLFQIINYAFPDALAAVNYYYDPYSHAVRMAISSLVIAFPLFWIISWVLNREYAHEPARKELWVRRWLVYLTLFLAGLTVMIDLIVLVNTFLGGEITARFILKVLSVLVVAGLIFGYYIYDLRAYPKGPSKVLTRFLIIAAVLIAVSIGIGVTVMGSPATQRAIQFDMERVNDLSMIQSDIMNYWSTKGALPESLNDLDNPLSETTLPTDPETGTRFEYHKTGDQSFSLCATFGASSTQTGPVPAIYPGANQTWVHGKGHQCFDRTVDPALYQNVNQKYLVPTENQPQNQ